MDRIDRLHESMDRSLQGLFDLPGAGRAAGSGALVGAIERDLGVERRLLGELDVRIPGLSGVDPLAMLLRGELDRLLVVLRTFDAPDPRRWEAALAELRLQLDAAFVAVDLALPDRG